MAHPKKNISYVPLDAPLIEPRTGLLTRVGSLLVRAVNDINDRLGGVLAPALPLRNYTVATLPDATVYTYSLVVVTDEAGGCTVAFSDSLVWRRVQDRAQVS
jgi:hypothetical protein